MSKKIKEANYRITLNNGKSHVVISEITNPVTFIASVPTSGFKYFELYMPKMDYDVHCKFNKVAINARDISSVEYYEIERKEE